MGPETPRRPKIENERSLSVRRLASVTVGFTAKQTAKQTFRALKAPVKMAARLTDRPSETVRRELPSPSRPAVDTAVLRSPGRVLVQAIREDVGGKKLNESGLVMRARTAGRRDVIVMAMATDTPTEHRTSAIIGVADGQRIGHFALSTAEPTLGARHLGVRVERSTSVDVGGITDTLEAAEALHDVQATLDRGEMTPYELVDVPEDEPVAWQAA